MAKEGKEDVFSSDYKGNSKEIGHYRGLDSEVKIVEYLASKLGGNRNAKGQVVIFTEKRACASCQGQGRKLITEEGEDVYNGVIDQFSEMYPNIEVVVYDAEGRKLILKGGKPFKP
ncbi:deaminase domain-containing protein [Laceyella putida]|uniref:Deaminase domain-containing protein n=1 Tax=Laceyella putida TaxID=110101 RepID=A0ABW2RJG8_9BACL